MLICPPKSRQRQAQSRRGYRTQRQQAWPTIDARMLDESRGQSVGRSTAVSVKQHLFWAFEVFAYSTLFRWSSLDVSTGFIDVMSCYEMARHTK